jgi:hypothetical protein
MADFYSAVNTMAGAVRCCAKGLTLTARPTHRPDTKPFDVIYDIDFIGAPKGNRTPVFAVKGA